MGYLKLRESEIYPLTVEELQAELEKANFEFETELFGKTKTLSASDAKNFKIPYQQAWAETPVFELVDSKGNKPKVGKKKGKPKMYGLETSGLAPINFSIQWKRDRKQPSGFRPIFSFK